MYSGRQKTLLSDLPKITFTNVNWSKVLIYTEYIWYVLGTAFALKVLFLLKVLNFGSPFNPNYCTVLFRIKAKFVDGLKDFAMNKCPNIFVSNF